MERAHGKVRKGPRDLNSRREESFERLVGTRSWGLSFLSSAAASSGVYLLSTVSEQLTFSLINSRLIVIQE